VGKLKDEGGGEGGRGMKVTTGQIERLPERLTSGLIGAKELTYFGREKKGRSG